MKDNKSYIPTPVYTICDKCSKEVILGVCAIVDNKTGKDYCDECAGTVRNSDGYIVGFTRSKHDVFGKDSYL